jgi:hypothetical protein
MTGDKTLLKEVQMGKGGRITYGDGSQSKVIGKGIIDIPGLGASQEALYVEGLKANLLSISQFYDNDLVVRFSKKECEKWKLTSNIKQVCAQSVNKITMRKINNTRIFVNEVENSI